MIILLGGTAETSEIAMAICRAGFSLLVCTATDIDLDVGDHPAIERHCGRLDRAALVELAQKHGASALVDVGHPYARELHETARGAAEDLGVPYFAYRRASSIDRNAVSFVKDHDTAAHRACSFGRTVLLTTGSQNIAPYINESRRTGVAIIARVLDHPSSREACLRAGLPEQAIVSGRGPYSVEQNLALLDRFDIGTLVTKDSGERGGVSAKLEAAARRGCHVVVVERPRDDRHCESTLDGLLAVIEASLTPVL